MALDEKWQDWLVKVKEAFGIISNELDAKLARLLVATNNHPTAEELAALVRRYVHQGSIDFAILKVVGELKDLLASGMKSVPKKNRSSLA